ncbi:ATP-binding protein [Fortiea contorta]|uniref:ATP-binding protein n=1 Tax=Fortiea contorta TaxID=1892405 RepID=UPI0012B63DD1|nr:ATP-binding protein [Fortiea contorta]
MGKLKQRQEFFPYRWVFFNDAFASFTGLNSKEYCNLPLVESYVEQFHQVFMNIFANAIDALEESILKKKINGTPQICIRTELRESNLVNVSTSDNDMEILNQVKQRLFNLFFTTKPLSKGTGMSLSISYQIISQKHRDS